MKSAEQALQALREGNQRFVEGASCLANHVSGARRTRVASGQEPFAIILGCSDSRVPAEIIFDQGLGDLFVIRIAGNIVAPSQIGSIEFAATSFGTRLVVVLGHSGCGAVAATLDALRNPHERRSPGLRSIVERITPAVTNLVEDHSTVCTDSLMGEAVRANVRRSVQQLRSGSAILERLLREDGLRVVGAEYALDSGVVEFLDDREVGDAAA